MLHLCSIRNIEQRERGVSIIVYTNNFLCEHNQITYKLLVRSNLQVDSAYFFISIASWLLLRNQEPTINQGVETFPIATKISRCSPFAFDPTFFEWVSLLSMMTIRLLSLDFLICSLKDCFIAISTILQFYFLSKIHTIKNNVTSFEVMDPQLESLNIWADSKSEHLSSCVEI